MSAVTAETLAPPATRAPILRPRLWWLAAPALLAFLLFFLLPVVSLLAISFDKALLRFRIPRRRRF